MAKIKRFTFIAIVMLAVCGALFFATPHAVYAEGVSISTWKIVAPVATFVQGNTKDGVTYYFWTPTNVELIYYGTENDEEKMTRLEVKPEDKGQPFNKIEIGNRYELKIRTTADMYVRTYTSAENEEENYLDTVTLDGIQYFKPKVDGALPQIMKNTLLPTLASNIWTVPFTAEDPGSDSQYFYAQSGLKSVRILKKRFVEEETVYDVVKDVHGKDLVFTFLGDADGKPPVKRESVKAVFRNARGDYYAELTDQVGNVRYQSILYLAEDTEQYSETISNAAKYIADTNLSVAIRQEVAATLESFMEAVNEKLTGDKFHAVHLTFIAAMKKANDAYEKGLNVVVNVENEEYLEGTLDAEFSEKNYGGKVMLGDTLELRITVAAFEYGKYKNPTAAAVSETKNPSGVLRLNVTMSYAGNTVAFAEPVKIYMRIPRAYRDISLVYTAGDKTSEVYGLQSGAEWITFAVDRAGTYDFFYEENSANLNYLWLLLLILPVGGAVAYVIIYSKKKVGKSNKDDKAHMVKARQSEKKNGAERSAEPSAEEDAEKTSVGNFGQKRGDTERGGRTGENGDAGSGENSEGTGKEKSGNGGTKAVKPKAADGNYSAQKKPQYPQKNTKNKSNKKKR